MNECAADYDSQLLLESYDETKLALINKSLS